MNIPFFFDVIASLINASFIKNPPGPQTQFSVGQFTFRARKYSMDSVILLESIILREYDRYIPALSPGDVIIDIGAHIGDFCIPAAKKFPYINVFGIEPHPVNHEFLLDNIRNNAAGNISPLRVAVGKSNGFILLTEDNANTGGSSVARRSGIKSFRVPSITLSTLFNQNRIIECKFLKMDCEGAEYDIIRAAPESILRSIQTIVMEYHNNGPIGELAEKLKKCGFTVLLTSGITNPILKPFVRAPFCIAINQRKVV